MAIHWQIPFKSLRSGTVYTANIYDANFSGTPIVLRGGAQPFITQENNDEDMFKLVRNQTGYVRIVDNGTDANGNAWNWKDILPATDTDRPVTLTHVENSTTITDWQGFMQAQNFGGTLYGNPQEREFPIQCPLTIIEGTDINYQQTEIQNFAYLLKLITDSIASESGGAVTIDNILVQGGLDAQSWLMKCIDWQNYLDLDNDDTIKAKYNLYEILEDLCSFWGWTARIHQKNLYLICADDDEMTLFLRLTTGTGGTLETLASGTAAGTATDIFTTVALSGDIFASVIQNDFRQRGPNHATVTATANQADNYVIDYAPVNVEKYLIKQTPVTEMIDGQGIGYYGDMTAFPTADAPSPMMTGSALAGYGSFSFILSAASNLNNSAIRIKKSYNSNIFASLESTYEHSFYNDNVNTIFYRGGIYLHGIIWQKRYRVEDYDELTKIGNYTMYMQLGIGKDRSTAKWWNGQAWTNSATPFLATVGNGDNILRTKSISAQYYIFDHISTDGIDLRGRLFVDFLGSSDLEEVEGQRAFFITDFNVEFMRDQLLVAKGSSSWYELSTSKEYDARNNNNVRQEWNADCIYASENEMAFGYGVLINPDGTYMKDATYGNAVERPEQHLANRVADYWAIAKRKVDVELRSNISIGGVVLNNISPQNKITIDSTTCYPVAISHEWHDDIVKLILLELPTT